MTGQRILAAVQKIAWALFLLCLPVTSFPFFPPAIGGGALVRPLSLYPLVVLMILVTLPRLLARPVPKTLLTLLPFILVAAASSLLSLLRGIEPALGIPVYERILRAMLTLGLGVAFYTTITLLHQAPEDLRFSLRWMYAGLAIALFIGSLQTIYVIHYTPQWFRLMERLQDYLSVRRLLTTRISGMTYEPNWFAEQISFLYMPWLLASVVYGYTAFRQRWRFVTVELFLLLWSVPILAFTYSRAGLVNLLALAGLALLFLRPRAPRQERVRRPVQVWTRRLIEAALVMVVLAGLIRFAGSKNAFFARIWGYWRSSPTPTLSGYFDYLGFGARFIYGTAAYNTYSYAPLFGVGLGNFGYYFEQMLPDEPLAPIPEVLRIITPDASRDRLITAKVLYLRLLAETGLVGTAAFVVFIIAILGCALYLWLSRDREQKTWGTAGLLGVVAFLAAALSFDSFAIPNMWVVFGLITSSAWVFTRSAPAPKIAQAEKGESTAKTPVSIPGD
jgi:hypothetical protein